jgi:hypothetical protein
MDCVTELLTEYLRPDRHPTEPWVLAALYSTSIVVDSSTGIFAHVCSDTSNVCVLLQTAKCERALIFACTGSV